MPNLPYIHIPDSPHPSLPQGFANREELLLKLVTNLVEVGNLVSNGREPGRLSSLVVHGHKGVGKSSLIVEALRAIRGELDFGPGFRSRISKEMLPKAQQSERWVILYLRGKTSRDIKDATTNAQITLQSALTGMLSSDQMIPELSKNKPQELDLLGRFFNRTENSTREALRSAIQNTIIELQKARERQGGIRTTKEVQQTQKSSRSDASAGLRETFSVGQGGNRIAAAVNLEIEDKYLLNTNKDITEETRQEMNVDMFVDALNPFFTRCAELKIPTFLVLDDADELVTFADSHARRSEFLRIILGTVGRLNCTALVLGLRNEYLQEDVYRNFTTYPVQPLTPTAAFLALDAWLDLQHQPPSSEGRQLCQDVAHTLLSGHTQDEPNVVPWVFFRVLQSVDRSRDLSGHSARALLESSLKATYPSQTVRLLIRLSECMSEDDRNSCLSAEPLDPTPFALKMTERQDLEQKGLLSSAFPGNTQDIRIILNQIVAWLAVAPQ